MTIVGWCFGCGRVRHWPPPWPPDRRRYHFGFMDGKRCGPVWPGVRVRDQAELDRRVPELLAIDAPGHWLEWVPSGGPIDPRFSIPWTPRIRWLRISADPDGPPADLADVRAVVREAQNARVPVWIERLGTIQGNQYFDGAHPAEWPSDLRRCRELPEVE